MSYTCGLGEPIPDLPDTGGTCCYGSAVYGPERCTCWRPIYGPAQADPELDTVTLLELGVPPDTRSTLCGDCAYRPESPEKAGDPEHRGDATELERLAEVGELFWCHQGMRQIVRWQHPSGAEIPGHAANYTPPLISTPSGPVAFKTDGTAAELCGGWAARRRAILGGAHAEALRGDEPASLTVTQESTEEGRRRDRAR